MTESVQISRTAPVLKSQDFALLRQEGLEVIQALASETWTDHNLHDPGITILEALCYALTEGGLRAGMDVKDLIRTSAIKRPAEFHTALSVLPTSPVHVQDLRKVLIDHPQLLNAWVFPLLAEPRGRYSALLEFTDAKLNSNIYTITVTPLLLGQPFEVDIAFPHWDDEDVILLREDVVIVSIVFDGAPLDIWNSIEGSKSFFARASVTVQPTVGPQQVMQIWIVAQINTFMDDPGTQSPLILADVVTAITAIGDNSPADQTLLKQFNRRVSSAQEHMRQVRRYIRDYRNLCEDLTDLRAVRQQEIAISGIIEVGSGVNIESLLAEIYAEISAFIDARLVFTPLGVTLSDGTSADLVVDGPTLDHGYLPNSDTAPDQIIETIYTSDILRIIYQLRNADGSDVVRREEISLRNIIAVRNLSLANYLDNRPITTNARDCLQLVKSQRHVPVLSVPKSHIVIYRNGIEIEYDEERVLALYQQAQALSLPVEVSAIDDLPVPSGEAYPAGDFYPVQYDLPLAYGVSLSGLPEHVTIDRRAQARQLQGYLLHFEHLIAGLHAQLDDFNTFFSPDPDIRHALIQSPLYHIQGIDGLLTAFDPASTTWANFIVNPNNAYARTLATALEDRERFLNKRNAVLDHLLATEGEEMQERTSLLLRLASQVANPSSYTLEQLLQLQHRQRLDTLEAIIEDKALYYRAIPDLNKNKYQAFGHPLWRVPAAVRVSETTQGFAWIISIDGVDVLRNVAILPATNQDAQRQAWHTFKIATRVSAYFIRLEAGGMRRLELRPHPGHAAIGESVATFANLPLAIAATLSTSALVRNDWLLNALLPYECRLYHLLGIDVKQRRRLIHQVASFIEIFDEVDVDPFIEKRFRLWENAGFGGSILAESIDNYPGATDPIATANARVAIGDFLRRGMIAQNYLVLATGLNTFRAVLTLDDGTPFVQSPLIFNHEKDAIAEIRRIRLHLFRFLSAEGFYCIEHAPLFDETLVPELSIKGIKDPYAFQMTIVLPSGYARDFAVVNSPKVEIQPDLYRGAEFRKYAEQQIRKHCPAHILPRMIWVDRAVPGSVVALADPCFENFETAYRNWCVTFLSDEPEAAVINPVRNALVTLLNTLYQEYYQDS